MNHLAHTTKSTSSGDTMRAYESYKKVCSWSDQKPMELEAWIQQANVFHGYSQPCGWNDRQMPDNVAGVDTRNHRHSQSGDCRMKVKEIPPSDCKIRPWGI